MNLHFLRLIAAVAALALTGATRADEKKAAPAVDPFDQSKVPLEVEPPADFKGKKLVLVAGRLSHGAGDHEFFAGTAILMNLLKQTPNVWPVMARDGWPKNEKIFEGADSILFYMDGRGGHPVVQGDRMDKIQKLMDKGVGWVNLHYAVDYLPKHGKTVLGWMGGYYEPDYSINPHWDAAFRELPKHAITKGVKPFTLRDEWYYNMRFVEDMKDVTPILVAIPPDGTRGTPAAKMHPGRPEIVAWSYERKDGGRGFGFTGGHFHRNWADEDYRRLVVNAILWSAKVDVHRDRLRGLVLRQREILVSRQAADQNGDLLTAHSTPQLTYLHTCFGRSCLSNHPTRFFRIVTTAINERRGLRVGLIDRWAQANPCNLPRSDTPTRTGLLKTSSQGDSRRSSNRQCSSRIATIELHLPEGGTETRPSVERATQFGGAI